MDTPKNSTSRRTSKDEGEAEFHKPGRLLMLVLFATSMVAGCQSNAAGKPGYQPTGCGMVGSSCESGR